MRRIALALVCIGLYPVQSLTHPSQTAQSPVFRSTVELVQVDVVVLDKDGKQVRGLTVDDFELLDRKKPQKIASFEELSHARVVNPAAAAPPEALMTVKADVADNQTTPERLVVMVLDDLHGFRGRDDVVKKIARTVITDLGPKASMAVLFTSGEGSTQIGSDRSRFLAAVETYKGRKAVRRPTRAMDNQRSARINPEGGLAALDSVATAQTVSLQDFQDNMTTLKTLQDAASLVGADDGRRKAFIWVSESMAFEASGLFDAHAPPGAIPAGGAEYAMGGDAAATIEPEGASYHAWGILDMMDAMRRSNVATFAVDPRGKIDYKDFARECVPPLPGLGCDPCTGDCHGGLPERDSHIRISQRALDLISRASGGFAIVNTNDFDSGLRRIIDDLDHYYMLGFYPADVKGKGYRPLDVRVKGRPDLTLRFRHGYSPAGAPPPPKNSDPLVALSSGVMPKTDLPLRLFAMPLTTEAPAATGAAKLTRVAVALEVTGPTQTLREADNMLRDEISYELLVVDDKKSKVTSRTGEAARWVMKGKDGGEKMPEIVSYQLPLTVDLKPGQYQFRASAISAKFGKGGSVYLTVDVPDFATQPLMLSGLAVGYVEGSRIPVARTTTEPASPAAVPAPLPALPFDPALDRQFTTADSLRLYFEVARADKSVPLKGTLDLMNDKDVVTSTFDLDLPADHHGRVDVPLPLDGMTPGPYRLRVKISDGSKTVEKTVGVVINAPVVK
jgi:VWFA-related protein